jgi:GNAT superfamily N-acetyltransferase
MTPAPPSVDGGRLEVRHATNRDLQRLAPLFDAYRTFYGQDSDHGAAGAFLAARLSRRESAVLLALLRRPAATRSDVVGFAQLYRSFSSVSLAPTVILNDLYVLPAARRLGVGGQLLDAAACYARTVGAVRLELATQHGNEPALRLYLAKGFVRDTEFTHLSLTLQ